MEGGYSRGNMYGRVVKIGGRLGRRAGRRCQRILGGMERERGGMREVEEEEGGEWEGAESVRVRESM